MGDFIVTCPYQKYFEFFHNILKLVLEFRRQFQLSKYEFNFSLRLLNIVIFFNCVPSLYMMNLKLTFDKYFLYTVCISNKQC